MDGVEAPKPRPRDVTRFEYDGMGRLARILPDGATERFSYDLAGNRTSRTDSKA